MRLHFSLKIRHLILGKLKPIILFMVQNTPLMFYIFALRFLLEFVRFLSSLLHPTQSIFSPLYDFNTWIPIVRLSQTRERATSFGKKNLLNFFPNVLEKRVQTIKKGPLNNPRTTSRWASSKLNFIQINIGNSFILWLVEANAMKRI